MSLVRTIRRAQLARAGALVKPRPIVVEPVRIVGMSKAVDGAYEPKLLKRVTSAGYALLIVALAFWIVAAAAEVSR